MSAKHAQYVIILRLGRKQMSKNQVVMSIFKMADSGESTDKEYVLCSTDQISSPTTHLTSLTCLL